MTLSRLLLLFVLASLATLAQAGPRDAQATRIEHGRYLAHASDCAACHTPENGMPYAGGPPIDTPFGIVYGTNITPDRQYGIGNYSADDFFHALTEGETPSGRQLYPAMPYTAYHGIRRADADDMYAYFMSLSPVHRPGPQTDLAWPFSMRWTLNIWNWLFAPDDTGKVDTPTPGANPTTLDRGRYLVDTLGHCGACHTPRNIAGAARHDAYLQGNVIDGYLAPSLTPEALARRGWDSTSLRTYFKSGTSKQGSMYGPMYPVFAHSTKYLQNDDIAALVTYLMHAPQALPATPAPDEQPPSDSGQQTYLNHCSGCHGAQGRGVPHVAAGLYANSTVRLTDPRNLIRIIHDGLDARNFTDDARVQAMPGFADTLDDKEIATLVTWLRRRWGGHEKPISPTAVTDMTTAE